MKSFGIISFYSVVVFFANYFLIDIEDLVLHQFSTQESLGIPESAIWESIDNLKYWNRFSIIFTFLLFSLKGMIISLLLYTGLFLEDLHKKIHFASLFKIAVYAECILVIAGLIKVIVVAFGEFSYDLLVKYYPLSLLNFFDYNEINMLFVYPLQLANVFELAYIFLLIYFLKEEIEIPFFNSFKIVVSSYGTALLCWVVFVVFLTLNFS